MKAAWIEKKQQQPCSLRVAVTECRAQGRIRIAPGGSTKTPVHSASDETTLRALERVHTTCKRRATTMPCPSQTSGKKQNLDPTARQGAFQSDTCCTRTVTHSPKSARRLQERGACRRQLEPAPSPSLPREAPQARTPGSAR